MIRTTTNLACPCPAAPGLHGTGKELVFAAPQIAGATLATASAMGAAWATAAIPVVGPIIAGVTVALMLIFSRKRPGQKIATTEIVDQIEPFLEENLRGYMEGPHNPTSQAQALENFNAAWQFVVESCCPGGPPKCQPMGPPGRWCIEDREAGGKHDWFARYRDPIANDPTWKRTTAAPDVVGQITEAGRQVLAPILAEGKGIGTLLIAAALILGGLSLK